MDFLSQKLSDYIHFYSEDEREILSELNRETYEKVLNPRMLSGHLQGTFLQMFSKLINPKNILEIGTYTGYSAICLATGLKQEGMLYTIDINEELENFAKKYFKKAGLNNQITQLVGNAVDIIPTLNEFFDLIFIDADKENYCAYYDLVFDKLNVGGYIIADNVLWSGKVLEVKNNDEETLGIKKYNKKVHEDSRVKNILLPIRDGLMICEKTAH